MGIVILGVALLLIFVGTRDIPHHPSPYIYGEDE